MLVIGGGQLGRVTPILMICGVSYGISLRFDDQRRNIRVVADPDQGPSTGSSCLCTPMAAVKGLSGSDGSYVYVATIGTKDGGGQVHRGHNDTGAWNQFTNLMPIQPVTQFDSPIIINLCL